jgi:hypothetical protein
MNDKLLTLHDAPQVLRDVHNEDERSLRVLVNNDLVPVRFSKVTCTYVTSGDGIGEIATATYWDEGIQQVSSFIPNSENEGRQEITNLDFDFIKAVNLHDKYLILHDDVGTVAIVFLVNDVAQTTVTGADRDIVVNLSSIDIPRIIAIKTKQIIEADSKFLALTSNNLVLVISDGIGNKPDSYDVNTGITVTNIDGNDSKTLNDKYFTLYRPNNDKFHVWLNVDGLGVDPAPASSTAIPVAITSSNNRDQVAAAIITAINNTLYFTAYKSNGRVFIRAKEAGITTSIENFNTSFSFFETEVAGASKKVIKTLVLTYDSNSCLTEIDSF